MKNNEELKKAIKDFIESGLEIYDLWDDKLDKNYPFDKDFLEVMHEIMTWTEDIRL